MRVIRHDRDGSSLNGRIDKACAIGLAAAECEKYIARPHGAAVHGQSRHRKLTCLLVESGITAEKFA
ncbi:hypothetical protein GCM10022626_19110 [[Pseudomonas] carboxydohydrogena]